MRITGGTDRGRQLASLKGYAIRPTTDKVREAIFNIIGQDLSGCRILDLFCGTGSLGLESLSRGAISAFFIDNAQQALTLTKKNLEVSGYTESAIVLKWDLTKGIPSGNIVSDCCFDVVFLDPPYGKNLIPSLLDSIYSKAQLSPGVRIIAESGKKDELPDRVKQMKMIDTRIYGDSKINIYSLTEKQWKKK